MPERRRLVGTFKSVRLVRTENHGIENLKSKSENNFRTRVIRLD